MNWKRTFIQQSLSGQLLALVAVSAVLPLLVATVVLTWFEHHQQTADVVELLDARADQVALEADTFHDFFGRTAERWATASQAAQVLAELPQAATQLTAQLGVMMSKVVGGDPRIAATVLLNPQGQVVVSSMPTALPAGSRWAAFAPLSQAVADARPGQHPVTPLRERGEPERLVFGQLVVGKGVADRDKSVTDRGTAEPLGYIAVVVYTKDFMAAIRLGDGRAGTDSYSQVFDEFGVRVAHSRTDSALYHPAAVQSPATLTMLIRTQRYGPDTALLLSQVIPAPKMAAQLSQTDSPRVFRGWAPVGSGLCADRQARAAAWAVDAILFPAGAHC